MLNHSQEPPKPAPKFITMADNHKNIVLIPIDQENIVTIFKNMGYHEVPTTEPDHADDEQ